MKCRVVSLFLIIEIFSVVLARVIVVVQHRKIYHRNFPNSHKSQVKYEMPPLTGNTASNGV